MSSLWGARSIVLQPGVDQVIDDYTASIPRFDEAYRGMEWLLARNPMRGMTKSEGGIEWRVYVQEQDTIAKTPRIWVLFTVSENEVVIYGINAVPFVLDEFKAD